ncbi:amidohydrolase family protein [Ruminococcaceae bacterium OttesenSCG-928-I18]|nr:amidohydrolase family protein [Ruminococcaceae bacterium OttesenSCG-928-I18]
MRKPCEVPQDKSASARRLLLKRGHVVDPANGVEDVLDIAVSGEEIVEVGRNIPAEKQDLVIDAEGLMVWPGLVDMHLHLGDLFEVDTQPIMRAVADGVTVAFTPGAGNTLMAPCLLGAEMDRGLPLNAGVFVGAANMLGTMLEDEEIVMLLKGVLPEEVAFCKLSKNELTNRMAPLVVGVKDHMGHFLMSDENVKRVASICGRTGLLYMSHTQDPEHTRRIASLASGLSPVHLTHMTAAGCGTHGDPLESMREVLALCARADITGDFVTTMIRKGRGSREGLQMAEEARQVCLEALHDGVVNILVSDGQNQSVMKGFGDSRDNIPALLELAEDKILTLPQAVATMTCNPVSLFEKVTGRSWWTEKLGHLGKGAKANITVVDRQDKLATYTIVNGKTAAFENRVVRSGMAAGHWVSAFGIEKDLGIGKRGMYT